MNPLIKYGAAVALVLAALFGAYHHGCSVTQADADLVAEKAARQAVTAQTALAEFYRQREETAAEDMAKIDQQHQEDLRNANLISERSIAGLRDGTLRLRSKFAACSAAHGGVPEAAAGAGVRDADAGSGLQPEDVQSLIRSAALADQVVVQLQACQAIVKLDRGVN